jgi:LPXTG-site transpeptidase (sortase) family protein
MLRQIKYFFFLLSLLFFFLAIKMLLIRQAPKTYSYPQINTTFSGPYEINFPSLNLSLPIYSVTKEGDHLPTVSNGISFLDSSSLPGQPGITIFYGHNWLSLLGRLKQIKLGEELTVKLSDNKQYQYIVDQIAVVNPDDKYLPEDTSQSRLVIYTCAGIFDEKRLLVSAKISSLP